MPRVVQPPDLGTQLLFLYCFNSIQFDRKSPSPRFVDQLSDYFRQRRIHLVSFLTLF
ncbi:hypothetical protein OIU77_005174 [Salix suchowensis]|uniref:Uncharacterized protein n=1 Tax=Salix suchowensis TaxID=1278906 RepID=A0ABQ9ANJ0_9ROSI|nr:hypothetical protein OIU77_005174 [Salix suchowensis]